MLPAGYSFSSNQFTPLLFHFQNVKANWCCLVFINSCRGHISIQCWIGNQTFSLCEGWSYQLWDWTVVWSRGFWALPWCEIYHRGGISEPFGLTKKMNHLLLVIKLLLAIIEKLSPTGICVYAQVSCYHSAECEPCCSKLLYNILRESVCRLAYIIPILALNLKTWLELF